MILTRGVQRAIVAVFSSLLAAIYLAAWLAPATGLNHQDADYLVAANALASGHGYRIDSLPDPIPQTGFPPLFPAVLALFTLVFHKLQWLKLLPLACSAGWLVLTRKLLLRMGASKNAALLLLGLTAASPWMVFLSTDLFAETLFACLVTAALLALLDERALMAGAFAGMATLTMETGAALIIACIVTLAARRRFRSAVIFAAAAMLIVGPWFGWSLAQITRDASYGTNGYIASNILTGLSASEKLVVLSRNFLTLFSRPLSLLTGITTPYAAIATVLIVGWSLFRRRQLVPDLFVAFYSLVLICQISPPESSVVPILPLILWMVWRVSRLRVNREALAALVLISVSLAFSADLRQLPAASAAGSFQPSGPPIDNWNEMEKLFGFIRANTTPDSVIAANLDSAFYLETGRKTIRGFVPDGFGLYYAPRRSAVTPDRLARDILQAKAGYLALTPDDGLAESESLHRSVEALERGGLLEPMPIPGESREYRLLRVVR